MGIYDKEVKERLGDESWSVILESVNRGAIDAQKMKDIAQQMSPKVGGNHKRRMQAGMNDQSEMREVLSGWWEEEMHDMDRNAVFDKLVTIFGSDTVSLSALAERLKKVKSDFEEAEFIESEQRAASPSPKTGLTKIEESVSESVTEDPEETRKRTRISNRNTTVFASLRGPKKKKKQYTKTTRTKRTEKPRARISDGLFDPATMCEVEHD